MLEVGPNGAAQLLLDHMVAVKIVQAQPAGELAPDGGFARTGQADQSDACLFGHLVGCIHRAQGNTTLKELTLPLTVAVNRTMSPAAQLLRVAVC